MFGGIHKGRKVVVVGFRLGAEGDVGGVLRKGNGFQLSCPEEPAPWSWDLDPAWRVGSGLDREEDLRCRSWVMERDKRWGRKSRGKWTLD